jgi:hypothetical protein
MKRRLLRNTAGLLITVFVFAFLPLTLSALTIEQGRIRLVLHEDSGKFSLYYLENLKKDRYESLLFERDPRTSSLGLLVDNKIITLGPTSRFEQTVDRRVDGARFIWISDDLRVTETFRFVKSRPNGLVDGVEIGVQVRNDSRSLKNVGIHMLFDTYLGEDEKAHFETSDGEKLNGETSFSTGMPGYWVSPSDSDAYEGLQGMLTGNGISRPVRVVFANWKRLNEELWNLEVRNDRNFNLPPYSINDSAVCHFYGPERIGSGKSVSVTTVLGAARGSAFSSGDSRKSSDDESAESTDESIEKLRSSISGSSAAEEQSVEEKLIVVNDILSNIDALLSNPDELSEEKIEVLEEALSELQQRQESNTDTSP